MWTKLELSDISERVSSRYLMECVQRFIIYVKKSIYDVTDITVNTPENWDYSGKLSKFSLSNLKNDTHGNFCL